MLVEFRADMGFNGTRIQINPRCVSSVIEMEPKRTNIYMFGNSEEPYSILEPFNKVVDKINSGIRADPLTPETL